MPSPSGFGDSVACQPAGGRFVGGRLLVVTVVLGVDVTLGLLVTVAVLVLVDGGGTTTVVVTVLTDEVVLDEAVGAAITPQATRLPASSAGPAPRFPGSW